MLPRTCSQDKHACGPCKVIFNSAKPKPHFSLKEVPSEVKPNVQQRPHNNQITSSRVIESVESNRTVTAVRLASSHRRHNHTSQTASTKGRHFSDQRQQLSVISTRYQSHIKMKYSLATLAAVLVSSSVVVHAQSPVCDFEVDDLPVPSHAAANMAAGHVNGKSTMTVCDSTNPGRSKAFSIVSSSDFGPAGGQPNESWSGRADDGSEMTVVVDARGHATASITDLPRKTVTDVYRDAQGKSQSVTRSVNDYPDEADPEDVGGGVVDLTVGVDDLNRRALRGGDAGANKEDGPRRRLFDDGSELDVLVLWTEFAECKNSGLARGCAPTATTEANIRNRIVSPVLLAWFPAIPFNIFIFCRQCRIVCCMLFLSLTPQPTTISHTITEPGLHRNQRRLQRLRRQHADQPGPRPKDHLRRQRQLQHILERSSNEWGWQDG